MRPDVIISRSTAATAALLYETRTRPVVFLLISDPVGDGFVVSMARPAGHATGFTDIPASMAGKWLELLKEMVPRISRVAVMYGSGTAPGDGLYYLRSIQAEAHSKHLKMAGIRVNNPGEIERGISGIAREPDGALIVTPDLTTTLYRDAIIRMTLRYRVPAMYPFRYVAAEGGLISYGVDVADQYRHAAEYVDRILKGAKPRELPVQAPTKFELAINLKTAKALGLDVPGTLLARADEVIKMKRREFILLGVTSVAGPMAGRAADETNPSDRLPWKRSHDPGAGRRRGFPGRSSEHGSVEGENIVVDVGLRRVQPNNHSVRR